MLQPRQPVYCNMYGILFHGSFYPVLALVHSMRSTCLLVYFNLEILSSSFHAQVHRYYILNTTKFPFFFFFFFLLDKINYPGVLFLGSPLFIYLSVHRLLLVAPCQLSSSTIGILLALHLSRQHITAYLY